ncbi:heavy metal-associated isoprenylated plant protein 39 [Cryptomeria japonica]|uniref:heavy metal-associated isoprenylated plant protein 39 n=1 Tax=Cryptomeria japonica TaxID=3369 RepID=UPI0025ABFCDB|nr:heavy metal-associated isoprenylated plant protein 39 [Cryptomeria japonica]
MKKMVLKLSIENEKSKKRALKTVAGVQGVESVAVDMKEKKMTVIGEVDPVNVTSKLRKFGYTELLSVGPAKEEKKEAPQKQEAKKEGKKPEPAKTVVYVHRPDEYTAFSDENPNACTIS